MGRDDFGHLPINTRVKSAYREIQYLGHNYNHFTCLSLSMECKLLEILYHVSPFSLAVFVFLEHIRKQVNNCRVDK